MAKDMNISLLFDFYGDMLTEKQRDVIEFYYNDDLSLAEIAENEGITRQGVRDSIKRAESILVDMEDRLGLAQRFHGMRNCFESICAAAGKIQELNRRHSYSRDIESQVGKIIELSRDLSEL